MTIFIIVLKKLIKQQLSELTASLNAKAKSYGYNADLSNEQKDLIEKLELRLANFKDSGNDAIDHNRIVKLLETVWAKVRVVRENHGEPKDEGDTITCLSKLMLHTRAFHTKLNTLSKTSFSLLNMAYEQTPQHIVYYHAVFYFGEEVFNPLTSGDTSIRLKKEGHLLNRLHSLSEIIKPTHNLKEQKSRTIQILADLGNDNKMAIQQEKDSVDVPGLTFWGWQVTLPTSWFGPGLGRMNKQFNQALRKINEMTPEMFKKTISEDEFDDELDTQVEEENNNQAIDDDGDEAAHVADADVVNKPEEIAAPAPSI